MIYFITNDSSHLKHYQEKLYDNIEAVPDDENTLEFFSAYISDAGEIIGYDVESNGLDCWKNNTILRIIGDEDNQFILHTPFCDTGAYMDILLEEDKTLLGHNIKFDIKFAYTEDKLVFKKVYDVMIAEQRLYMKLGIRFALDQMCVRYLDKYPDAMDKTIRLEFVGQDPYKFKVEPRHLYYGAGDVSNLFPIKEKQEILIEKYKMQFLIYNIEFPLIPIIAKAEYTGFEFDIDTWLLIYEENNTKRIELEHKLDKITRELRDTLLPVGSPNRFYMIGGKWDNPRKHNPQYDVFNEDGTTNTMNLFGEPMKLNTLVGSKAKVPKKIDKSPNNINFSSETVITEIFGRLEQPLLTKEGNLVVPTFNKNQKVDKSTYSYLTGEGAFHEYLTQLPNTIMKEFIETLLEHRHMDTACNNFGRNYVNKINPITNKIHTVFRQCRAVTGRFQSGGGKAEPDKPNFQNIPSKADYAIRMRNCFKSKKGYSIGTHDLSGAELIIMCSLSQDMKLLEIASGDMHSFVAQNSWRRIYANRAQNMINIHEALREENGKDYTDTDMVRQINEYITLSREYIVNKKTKNVRAAFKPMTFGTIYGMYAAKAGKTLNIPKEEGQIVINFIKATFPDVFRMVENASAFAKHYGYLILNERTNSRVYFPNLIKLKRGEITERTHFGIISKEESEARNIRIQGTQADMIKEASVELQYWIDENGYTDEIIILSWVHDEIVDEHPDYLNGKSEDWKKWRQQDNFLIYNGEEYHSFPEVKQQIMIDVSNRYLDNVEMKCDYDVEPYWTK